MGKKIDVENKPVSYIKILVLNTYHWGSTVVGIIFLCFLWPPNYMAQLSCLKWNSL